MSVLATDGQQLTLIYNSESSIAKQTLGYVQSVEKEIQTIDISKTTLGDTVWVTIAEGLNVPLHGLFSKDHPDAPDVSEESYTTDDWLKILKKNPSLIQAPIAINGKNYLQVASPSEILKFFEVDTAGLEKKNVGDSPTTSSQAEEDDFV